MDDFWKCQNLYEEKEEHEWTNKLLTKKKEKDTAVVIKDLVPVKSQTQNIL